MTLLRGGRVRDSLLPGQVPCTGVLNERSLRVVESLSLLGYLGEDGGVQ